MLRHGKLQGSPSRGAMCVIATAQACRPVAKKAPRCDALESAGCRCHPHCARTSACVLLEPRRVTPPTPACAPAAEPAVHEACGRDGRAGGQPLGHLGQGAAGGCCSNERTCLRTPRKLVCSCRPAPPAAWAVAWALEPTQAPLWSCCLWSYFLGWSPLSAPPVGPPL